MADVKISALPASTTPLAGTEVFPVVKGGQTRQVSVNNLTTGKAVSATQYTSTIATGTAPLVVASTTEVANLKAANATSADTANQVKSNATTGVLQVAGPGTGTTRVMTTPNANFTAARTDAAQTFSGDQTINAGGLYLNGATKKYYLYGDSLDNLSVVRYSLAGDFEALPFRILPNNDIVALSGNFVVGTSGKGIDFSATAGTGTSELLADYEEGTFTPTITFGGASTDITYDAGYTTASYVKIGRQVFVTISVLLTNKGSASGDAAIAGLPFTVANNINNFAASALGAAGMTQTGYAWAKVSPGSTFAYVYSTSDAGTRSLLTNTNFTNTTELQMSLSYYTS